MPSAFRFCQPTQTWFDETYDEPTPVQRRGWRTIGGDAHALLVAPTGSGKTLAAFLAGIDQCLQLPPDAPPGVRLLYVSPLKALVYDVQRNLNAPLTGIRHKAERLDLPIRDLRVAVRTGDRPQKERRLQAKEPADILVTTPESLFLILGSKAAETLRAVRTVIIDEIHSLAPTKRGVHLALSLERLARLCPNDPQRVGLSATVRPLDEIARFLGGQRPVDVIDTSAKPLIDLKVCVPVPDMETIIFVNSRGLCERLTQRLNELAGEELVRAHHGSVSHDKRAEIEDGLKQGSIKGIVATSSLELGIDMGAVDRVIMVESPGSVARGLQRAGRAGHSVGETSIARIFPRSNSW